jgi:hypothetical protein
MTATEEAIREIRESRCRMSAECGHDMRKYVERLKLYNEKYAVEVERYREAKRHQPEQPALAA